MLQKGLNLRYEPLRVHVHDGGHPQVQFGVVRFRRVFAVSAIVEVQRLLARGDEALAVKLAVQSEVLKGHGAEPTLDLLVVAAEGLYRDVYRGYVRFGNVAIGL